MLVAQGYFSKWLIPVPMLDQKAEKIVWILKDQIYCGGIPREVALMKF